MRDGKHSIDVYNSCLEGCYRRLSDKLGAQDLLSEVDHVVFHCTSTYLCRRAFAQICSLAKPDLCLRERRDLYDEMTGPSSRRTEVIRSTYTASVYVILYALFAQFDDAMIGRRVLVYSYGSGAASSLYSLRVRSLPALDKDIEALLGRRKFLPPGDFVALCDAYSATYGRFDVSVEARAEEEADAFYLRSIDAWGVRSYAPGAAGGGAAGAIGGAAAVWEAAE